MPPPIQRTDFRLDRVISVFPLGIAGEGGARYTLRNVLTSSMLGPLILEWDALPLTTDGLRWVLYTRATSGGTVRDDFNPSLITARQYFIPEGTFPPGIVVSAGMEAATITAIEAPTVSPITYEGGELGGAGDDFDPIIWPTIDSDGTAVFVSARNAAGAFEFQATAGVFSGAVAVIVTLSNAFEAAGVTEANPLRIVIGTGRASDEELRLVADDNGLDAFSQLVDSQVIALDSPDGDEAGEGIFQETREWIVRRAEMEQSVVLDEGRRFGVTEVKPLVRGRFWQISGERRYRGIVA